MSNKKRFRVAILGTGRRSRYLYGPILKGLPEEVELVSVWGRSVSSAKLLGERLGVPWFTDPDELVSKTAPDIGIVSVTYDANGEVGKMAAQLPMNLLLETPIAHNLEDARRIISQVTGNGFRLEVAEQFHRRPLEQIKRKLIESGIFGKVYTSFNDYLGHGYHGVSIMRSYLGFDTRILSVSGVSEKYALASHLSRLQGTRGARIETQEHGIFRFEGGKTGIFHWTDVGYDSALRWWRSSRFMAEKGMGITTGIGPEHETRLSLLAPGEEAPLYITIERRYEHIDGGALESMIAHTGLRTLPVVTWKNPLCCNEPGWNPQWHDDEIAVALCLLSLTDALRNDSLPTYGGEQAYRDQEAVLALRKSAEMGGVPVELPLKI